MSTSRSLQSLKFYLSVISVHLSVLAVSKTLLVGHSCPLFSVLAISKTLLVGHLVSTYRSLPSLKPCLSFKLCPRLGPYLTCRTRQDRWEIVIPWLKVRPSAKGALTHWRINQRTRNEFGLCHFFQFVPRALGEFVNVCDGPLSPGVKFELVRCGAVAWTARSIHQSFRLFHCFLNIVVFSLHFNRTK